MSKCEKCGEDFEEGKFGYCNNCIKKAFEQPIWHPFPEPKFYEQGWVCPKCGAVMSPRERYCPFCSPAQETEIWC